MKYKKDFSKSNKIIVYIAILIVIIITNIILAIFPFSDDEKIIIPSVIIALFLDIVGMAYFIIQDIINVLKTESYQIFEYKEREVPFVDRVEIIDKIMSTTLPLLDKKDEFYVSFDFKFGNSNGKKSLSYKVCKELIKLRNDKKNKKIGNVFFVNYSEDLKDYLRQNILLINNKKNIIVVHNANNSDFQFLDDTFKDKNVFFIFMNFTNESKNSLDFDKDKIFILLNELKQNPKFRHKIPSNGDDLNSLSNKLSVLSNNNIGNIITIILSDEFDILLETEYKFIEFYKAIRDANYPLAEEKFNNIRILTNRNKIYDYKCRYEHSNLLHFQCKYSLSLEIIDGLIDELSKYENLTQQHLVKKLYFDSVLLKSHVQKHMGDFKKSINTLADSAPIFSDNLLWVRSHFSVNIFRMNELKPNSPDWEQILEDTKKMMIYFRNNRSNNKNSDYYFYEAFYPIIEFYDNKFTKAKINQLIKIEEEAITFYDKNERRYLTNCLFIKAEFFRILNNNREAKKYYKKCFEIYKSNGDLDILYLLAITEKYNKILNGHNYNIVPNFEDVIKECMSSNEIYKFHNNLSAFCSLEIIFLLLMNKIKLDLNAISKIFGTSVSRETYREMRLIISESLNCKIVKGKKNGYYDIVLKELNS
ncbi:MAG: hypothetical protein IJY14_04395 [Acholeplasmatales bacterium]|nr:hypothetical protein [Acholeplasmatales bacterium]